MKTLHVLQVGVPTEDGRLIESVAIGADRDAGALVLVEQFDEWWRLVYGWDEELHGPAHEAVELPSPRIVQVFWMSEADGRWLNRIGFGADVPELPCWNIYHRGCVPSWWVARRLRPAVSWDCCDELPIPDMLDDDQAAAR